MSKKLEEFLLLSEYLTKHDGYITENTLQKYASTIIALNEQEELDLEEHKFMKDYLQNVIKAKISDKKVEDKVRERSDKTTATENDNDVQRIKLNELILTPEKYDGNRATARAWLDGYNRAATANGWNDKTKVKYFQTFLIKTADNWYATRMFNRVSNLTPWAEVEAKFIKYFIGDNLLHLHRQIQQTFQGERETCSTFSMRLLRLILMADPYMSEKEKISAILCRLRSEFQEKLCFVQPKTVEELNEACVAIENSIQAAKAASSIRRFAPKEDSRKRTDNKNTSISPSTRSRNSRITEHCNRCARDGHKKEDCFATKKADGSTLLDKSPKSPPKRVLPTKQTNTIVSTIKGSSQAPQTEINLKPEIKITKSVNVVTTVHLLKNEGNCRKRQQIHANVNLNNTKLEALIDTGSHESIISASLAAINGWNITGKSPELASANSNLMSCLGTTEIDFEITIGTITKQLRTKFVVIDELCVPALLGLELMAWLEITIQTKTGLLSFDKLPSQNGLLLDAPITIPPRSQIIVQAQVPAATCGVIQTIPYYTGSDLIVANSIDKIVNKKVNCLVANLNIKPLTLSDSIKLAAYEKVENSNQNVNTMINIGETEEVVAIGDELTIEQKKELITLIANNENAFSINGKLGHCKMAEHDIELLPNTKPIMEPMRRRPMEHQKEAQRQVESMLEEGIIQPSNSPWAAAYVLARKKSGEFRLCLDFRKLNDVTKKTAYPLPNTDECIETLAGKRYFSQLDMASGFWQLPLTPRAREYTSFRTETGQYEYIMMPFGLTNAPASFQRMVNAVFSGLKGINLQIFIDDLCLATDTWQEHLELLGKIFKLLIDTNLKLKGNKCLFGTNKVIFLGHEISKDGIRQDSNKMKAMIKMPIPRNSDDVRRALGSFNYYRKFVPNFSIMAEPLTRLTRKNIPFNWEQEQQIAWQNILDALARNATLKHFDHKAPTVLKTDASKKGIAGLLLQLEDNDWKIVACYSRRLSASEENYGITDLEGLAMVDSINHFRHYLLGKKFKVITDHCALCSLTKNMPKSARLRRWRIILAEYDMEIVYTNGSLHKDIDCLSRAPVENEIDKFLDDKIYLVNAKKVKPTTFLIFPLKPQEWKDLTSTDNEAKPFLSKARQRKNQFKFIDGILYKNNKLYVPQPKRAAILTQSHKAVEASHGGRQATMNRLEEYWWPSLERDVIKLVESCEECQKRKAPRQLPSGSIYHHELTEPFQQLALDCLGPFNPSLSQKRHVMVAVDSFSRFVYVKAVKNIQGSTCKKFLTEIIGHFGAPKEILTDNAPTYVNEDVKRVTEEFNILHRRTTPHHHEGNAICERIIQNLQEKMSIITNSHDTITDWELSLPAAALSLNTTCHTTTKYTPFELLFGRRHALQHPVTTHVTNSQQLYGELLQYRLDDRRATAIANTSDAQNRSERYTESHRKSTEFEIGALVLTRVMGRRSKLSYRFEGPYKVTNRDKDIYHIENIANDKIKLSRHVKDLKKYITNKTNLVMRPSKQHILLIIYITYQTNAAVMFERVNPIIWLNTKNYVTPGMMTYTFEDIVGSACEALLQYPGNENGQLGGAHAKCQQVFKEHITDKIARIGARIRNNQIINTNQRGNRSKRGVVDMLTGCFLTTVGETVLQTVWPNRGEEELRQNQNVLRSELEKMRANQNFTFLKQQAIAQAQELQAAIIEHNLDRLETIEHQHPELMIVASNIITKYQIIGMYIDKLRISFRQKEVNKADLAFFLNTDKFDDVDVLSIPTSSIRIWTYKQDSFGFSFAARRKAPDVNVYKVFPFKYWAHLDSEQPSLMEYAGPLHLVYNTSNNCIKGIATPQDNWVSVLCDEANYHDDQLAFWKNIAKPEDPFTQPAQTQFVTTWPYSYVYCLFGNITWENERAECPPYVFRINASSSWNTSDFRYSPAAIELQPFNTYYESTAQVHKIHFKKESYMVDEKQILKKSRELTKINYQLKQETIAISWSDTSKTSWKEVSTILLGAVACLIIGSGIFSVKLWFVSRRRHHSLMRTVVDALGGNGTYEEIRRTEKKKTVIALDELKKGFQTKINPDLPRRNNSNI